MNLFQINTTAYEEDDFFIGTTLNERQVSGVVREMMTIHRDEDLGVQFEAPDFVAAINKIYPDHITFLYNYIEVLSF